MATLQGVLDWLIQGVPGAKTAAEVVAQLCPRLRDAGIPVDHCEAFVRTLHPHIAGRTFLWRPDRDVTVTERSYAELHAPEMYSYAISALFFAGRAFRRKLTATATEPDLKALAADGYSDWFAGPLQFLSGELHGIAFATRRPSGFTDDDLAGLGRVLAPLSRIAEIFALSRTATNLLNTYVGQDAGARILAGQIQRGDTNAIDAVIWFSDLRNFTSMSSTLPPIEIIATLNEVFDCQVPAIEQRGGEVLKYMGDGMLAIFPCGDHDRAQRCDAAAAAASEALVALERLNERRVARGAVEVRFGIALHVGEVSYGNIGGAGRLDFTCIGPAVNLAARLEPLTGKLGKRVVVSDEFANLTTTALEPLGEFALKGVSGLAKAHAIR